MPVCEYGRARLYPDASVDDAVILCGARNLRVGAGHGHLDTAASALLQPPLDDRTWAACAGRAEPLDGGARPVIEPVEMPGPLFRDAPVNYGVILSAAKNLCVGEGHGHLDTAASALLQPPLDDRTWAACAGRAEPLDGGARPVIEPVEMPGPLFRDAPVNYGVILSAAKNLCVGEGHGHLDTAASALLQPPLDDRTWAACAGRAEPLDGGARPVIEPVEMPARCFEMYR